MPLSINGKRVSDHVLDREVLRLSAGLEMDAPQAGGLNPAQVRTLALNNVIDRSLLLQEAGRRGFNVTDAEVEIELTRRWGVSRNAICDPAAMQRIREDLLLERVSAALTRHVPRPARLEVERVYRANPHSFRLEEAVEAAHIFAEVTGPGDQSAALHALNAAEEELARGRPFAQVANRHSACKGVGGSVGWVTRGQMVPEFEDIVFKLEPGKRSGIFRTVFGLHIATIMRRRKAGIQPFDQVRHQIASGLFAEARRGALQQALLQLRSSAEVRYREEPRHA